MDIHAAIKHMYPQGEFVLNVTNGRITHWHSNVGDKKPTAAQLKYAWGKVKKSREDVSYKEKRAKEYPPIGDQLDAIWEELEQRELLAKAADDILKAILSVKQKYPKGDI